MKKKYVIIISTWFFTLLLGLIFALRIHLITEDTTGIYLLPTDNYFGFFMNYLPEITIIVTILGIHFRKKLGLIFSVAASAMSILSLVSEIIIYVVRTLDASAPVPNACLPWLDIPIIIVCFILFMIKFKIYTLPKEFKLK